MTLKIEDLIGKGDGKTVLVKKSNKREYSLVGVGAVGDRIFVEEVCSFEARVIHEHDFGDYEIKKTVKKYWQWLVKTDKGELYVGTYYCNEDGRTPAGEVFTSNEFIRKIGKPIDQDGNELEE